MNSTRIQVKYKCSCGSQDYMTMDMYEGACVRECISGEIAKHDADDQIGDHTRKYLIKCHQCGKQTTLRGVHSHDEFVDKYGRVGAIMDEMERINK